MRFAQPFILAWLWAVPLLAVILVLVDRRRQRRVERFAAREVLSEVNAGVDTRRRRWQRMLFLGVWVFSLIALARPQWGFEMREVKRQGLDILFLIDTSRSMLTTDVKPSRLERAKMAVRDFLKELQGDRVGLIAFAGDAFLVCPLTVDYGGFVMSLEDMDSNSIPRGGTNISKAIEEALREYDNTPAKYKVVVIITDGENLEDDPLPMVEEARKKGVKIYCIGVGTKEGELIRIKDTLGQDSYVKDENGNIVKSRLNEGLLTEIALKTGGVYVRASGAQFGLDLIYRNELSKLERRDITSRMERDYLERFQYPLLLAVLALCLMTCLPTRRAERS